MRDLRADLAMLASMKKSLGKADGLALIEGGHVIFAVLIHVNGAFVDVPSPPKAGSAIVVVSDENAVAQRAVHGDFQVGVGALHRAKIAAVLLNNVLQARPARKR